ncbi:radical SAM protein [Glycomyces sp. L485]|uniref:radical SAM protein n=1 Tax=Glycomyces sp. L485 TaxID=2909235 RepID=UPI001F4ACE7F|nr:radical SAM protein [Glycomyces sp. L485]MCH7232166.1 radical SAM protein [Glycomyces sp. L485]
MSGPTHAECEALRRTPGATAVLFLTDRCPVGCDHCSVGSLPRSPRITDWNLFTGIVDELGSREGLQLVALTGGEPFAERRGLQLATEALTANGKTTAVFTSGHWAGPRIPLWIRRVLQATGTVYLSTDSFHAASVKPPTVEAAARAVLESDCTLVVQVAGSREEADRWADRIPEAEVHRVPILPYGRGRLLRQGMAERPVADLGACHLLNSPTIRYDGTVTACCNEEVIIGGGPDRLRRQATRPEELGGILDGLAADPLHRILRRTGPAALASLLTQDRATLCGACWTLQDARSRQRHISVLFDLLESEAT